jgi:hypothetical protein
VALHARALDVSGLHAQHRVFPVQDVAVRARGGNTSVWCRW